MSVISLIAKEEYVTPQVQIISHVSQIALWTSCFILTLKETLQQKLSHFLNSALCFHLGGMSLGLCAQRSKSPYLVALMPL